MASTGTPITPDGPGLLGGWTRIHPVRAAAVAMILVSLVWRAQLASRGYLAVDDYVLIARAAESDLTPSFLLTLYNNHFMPAALLITWLVTRAAGLAYWPYVLLLTAAQAVLAVSFARLLRTLVRPGWALLVPLAVFLFSPLTLEATSWWAVGVNMLPMQIAMVLAVGAQVRYVRTGRKRHLATLALAVLFGLIFFEKALLVVPLVFLLTAFLFVGGPPVRAVLATVRRYWPSWLVLTALSLAFLALYGSRAESSLRRPDSLGEVLSFLWQLLGSTVVPGLLGGPWRWLPAGDGAPVTAPPELGRWIAWTVFLVLVVLTVRLRRVAGRAWLLFATYLALVTALLAATRLGSIYSDVAGAVPRYVSDVVVVAALCIGVALLGLRPAPDRFDPADPARTKRDGDPHPATDGGRADAASGQATADTASGQATADAERSELAPEPTGAEPRVAVPAATQRGHGVLHAEYDNDPPPPDRPPAARPFDAPPQRAGAGIGSQQSTATPSLPPSPAPDRPVSGAGGTAGPLSPPDQLTGGPEQPAFTGGRDPDDPPLPAVLVRHREAVSAGLALALVAAGLGAAWTTARFGDEWAVKSGRTYLDTVRAELAAAPPDTVFFDQPVPGDVVPTLSAPYNRQSTFFHALPEEPVFVTEAENPSLFDSTGRITPVKVDGPTAQPGPEQACGWKVTGGETARMPLTGPRDDWFWVVRIGYLSSGDTTGTFRLGGKEKQFPVRTGLHQIFFEFTGGGDTVELSVTDPGVTLCTNEVAIGTPTPQQ
ncbi:hypothetical protein EV384_0584 [Micromonospora kangleipakensis]|uniref:4-amino-4-deoxy-L-arabinose transferase-like glycosyltransferase n=1 Tax=Micromonospora kangleipakensis TaxID=1077942 RepID=A0A4Q8B5F1_9ACTN|nr:hypothetical protein [Micromonospora kangleipakensis]RZU72235.1 hypothetical protein EV384_0584 [Micromonospora kangleipakensis]